MVINVFTHHLCMTNNRIEGRPKGWYNILVYWYILVCCPLIYTDVAFRRLYYYLLVEETTC